MVYQYYDVKALLFGTAAGGCGLIHTSRNSKLVALKQIASNVSTDRLLYFAESDLRVLGVFCVTDLNFENTECDALADICRNFAWIRKSSVLLVTSHD